ncbi:hypothetical protein Ddc_14094 [Ditylenchus destructor]|nr:hypothetical protein Ddc_14094 [Ditylenchus destructor]
MMNCLIALFCVLAAVTCDLENACDENKARVYESTCSKYLAARPEGRSETCSIVLEYVECVTDAISATCGAEYATDFLKDPQTFENLGILQLPISELEAIPECRALIDFVGWRGGEAAYCPQAEWKSIMQAQITDGNATASADNIQAALLAQHPGRSFVVTCFEKKVNEDKPTIARPRPRGNRYCVVVKDNVWCRAVALRKW